MSNFVIEAQAHGLPAVVYDAQGIGECFLPGDTGFVIPPRRSGRRFARRIERLARRHAARNARPAPPGPRLRRRRPSTRNGTSRDYLELFARLTADADVRQPAR